MDSHYRPAPFPHDDALIHGHGIELAPTKPSYQEHHSQPGLEVATHSTLELAKSSPASHLHQKEHLLPHPGAVFDPSKLGWAEPNSKPSSIYRQSTTPSVGTTARGVRYSYSDFTSPFDRRPLVVTPPGVRGEGGDGEGGKRERICGVKRRLFWIILAFGIFVVVVAVATGVGVGVGMSEKKSTPSPTATSTRTLPIPTATFTSSPSASPISCPANNLTLYTSSANTQKKYLLLCGRDYNSNVGTTQDMYHTPTDTLSECLDACAQQDGCVGAGWGSGNVGGGVPICWLKSKLGAMNEALEWSFFVEDKEDVSETRRRGR